MVKPSLKSRPHHWGIAASIIVSLLYFSWAPFGMIGQRELFFDAMTQLGPAPRNDDVVVVDLSGFKANQWNRGDVAEVVERIAETAPAAIAFDLVFSAGCGLENPDNKRLAAAIGRSPSVLGFLIGEGQNGTPAPQPPLMTARPLSVPALWFIDAAESSCPEFAEHSHAAATAFLVGDLDARVRRAQAYSVIGSAAYPMLALEAVRLASAKGVAPILGGTDLWLKLGSRTISLLEDGNIRFVASSRQTIASRTIAAADLMKPGFDTSRLSSKIVFLGSSAPALGGLRESASMPLEPSVQIHADLATAISTGFIPTRDYRFVRYEALYVLLAGVLLAFAANRLQPTYTVIAGIGVICLSLIIAFGIYATSAFLVDGFSIAVSLSFVLATTVFFQYAHARRTERIARARFGQYLPQSVVSQYLDGNDLAGEERQITAFFTDIEGFSTLTKKLSPQELVSLLDTYFTEVNATISEAGGMIDKVVGDAVHALFNAPEDLRDHVDIAIRCAIAVSRLTEEMRNRPEFAKHDFGQTRIGIETGTAVIGEVGTGGKLDYTAHGDAINLAARLQEANKFLGTSICIGPTAYRECKLELVTLGEHDIRGFGTLELFTVTDKDVSEGLQSSPTLA